MLVYIVKRNHTNGVDFWEHLVEVTETYEGAVAAMNEDWERLGAPGELYQYSPGIMEIWREDSLRWESDEYYIELKELTR